MDAKCAAIRYVLSHIDPVTAVKIVHTFSLPSEEEECIILHDIKRKSLIQISDHLCVSPETVKRRRRSGLLKIADATLN